MCCSLPLMPLQESEQQLLVDPFNETMKPHLQIEP